MKLNLSLILFLLWTACLGQDTKSKNDTLYCMPKRYADSAAYELQKYDQLKVVHHAQQVELGYAYSVIEYMEKENLELDSLNSDNVNYYENVEIPRHKRKVRILGAAVAVETLLLLLILL